MQVTIVEIGDGSEEAQWDRFVLDHPMATGYHLMAWRHITAQSFGHRNFYLMAKNGDGQVKGVLPLVFVASRLFGRFLISVPFVNYGGVLFESLEAQTSLLREAVVLAKELKASHIELRQKEPLNLDWSIRQHKVSLRLKLPEQYELLWKGFPSKLRSQIRRAQKEGMSARTGGIELLGDFYSVFALNMRDLGTPVYTRKFFEIILETFPNEARILVVYLNEKPLAAGFLYVFRQVLEIPWASSNRKYNHLAPNMLLYSSTLEHACLKGCKEFDFGRSTQGSGTHRFKEQWGAKPTQLYWYYWKRTGSEVPVHSPTNGIYSLAATVWRRLPVAVANSLGPHIVKYLPIP